MSSYASFTLCANDSDDGGSPFIGVVGPNFDPTGLNVEANARAQSWMMWTCDGQLWHADAVSDWDGMPEEDELAPYTWLEEGDDVVVRLTLALTRRTQASRACAWRRA